MPRQRETAPAAAVAAPLPVAVLGDAERLACLRLIRTENVGPVAFRELVNLCGGAEKALARLPDLARRGGRRQTVSIYPRDKAEAELAAARVLGAAPLFTIEPGYPAALVHAGVPPPMLYIKGRTELLGRHAIAIVGSRNASAAGRTMAGQLAAGLGAGGMVVVSGLARGIDGAAHEASLKTGTVAVLAGGIDHIYPPEHERLHAEIGAQGCLVSELPPGFKARGNDFPRRNRIISGLSLAVIVVEAATRAGSLITARRAAEQGREVFAVPGHPLDPRAGNQPAPQERRDDRHVGADARRPGAAGAPPWRGVEECSSPEAGEFAAVAAGVPAAPDDGTVDADTVDGAQAAILAALGTAPISIDALARATGMPMRAVQAVVLELTLAERVERHGAQLISLRAETG